MTMKVGINKVFFIDKVLVCGIVPVKIIKVGRDLQKPHWSENCLSFVTTKLFIILLQKSIEYKFLKALSQCLKLFYRINISTFSSASFKYYFEGSVHYIRIYFCLKMKLVNYNCLKTY